MALATSRTAAPPPSRVAGQIIFDRFGPWLAPTAPAMSVAGLTMDIENITHSTELVDVLNALITELERSGYKSRALDEARALVARVSVL